MKNGIEITKEMATLIAELNPAEYLVWENDNPITEEELMSEFVLVFWGRAAHLEHKRDDFRITNIVYSPVISDLPDHLRVIETTSERNGYPANIRKAVIGFETFEEAEELAARHGMDVQYFETKDGWQFWYRTGNTAFEPMKISGESYGDNYRDYDPLDYEDEADFFDKEVREILSDCDFNSIDDVRLFLDEKEYLWNEISKASPDQLVIDTDNALSQNIVSKRAMYFYHDTNHFAIGII